MCCECQVAQEQDADAGSKALLWRVFPTPQTGGGEQEGPAALKLIKQIFPIADQY